MRRHRPQFHWIRWGKFLLWYIFCIVFLENMVVFLHFNGLSAVQERVDIVKDYGMRLQAHNQTFTSNRTVNTIQGNDTKSSDPEGAKTNRRRQQNQNKYPLKENKKYLGNVSNSVVVAKKPKPSVKKAPTKALPTNDPELERKYFMKKDHVVNPFSHKYIVTPHNLCDSRTFLMIIVHSFHPYSEKRLAIRQTWGRVAAGGSWPNLVINDTIKLVFMLGTHAQSGFNDKIRDESEVYNDIVQGDFIDDYKNMTLKSLLGLKWMNEQCPNAQFLLKSDDDMMINIPYLLQVLHSKTFKWTIMGPLNRGSKVYRSGKWKVTKEQYPFYTYPQYEAGAAYVLTNDLIKPLFETAQFVLPIHVDDVYITGILGKILYVNHAIQKGFAYWTDKPSTVCDILKNRKISATKMTPKRLTLLWKEIEKGECKEPQ